MSSTANLTSKFEDYAKQSAAPAGAKKEKVWTPHKDDDYSRQTAVKFNHPGGVPPPKKKISDLP
eukprot:gene1194-1507_t